MARRKLSSDDITEPIEQAASHPWMEKLARLGYAARGAVYFVVGLLATQAAFGVGGQTTDSKGALQAIVTQPFGKFLLVIITAGLIGYALWQILKTFVDPEHPGEKLGGKQIARRIGYGISAGSYAVLALTAIKLILGTGGGGDSNSTQDWTARILAQPFGQWLVGLAGLIVIGVGLYEIYNAFKGKFIEKLHLLNMNSNQRSLTIALGKLGITARGIIFMMIGAFLIQAALAVDPNRAKGLGDTLETLAQQPFGPWLLGVVALGLIAYSLYSLVEARYRQLT